jgi:hypothetical protein
MRRRSFLIGVANTVGLITAGRASGQPVGDAPFLEEQRGDESLPYEQVRIDPQKISRIVNPDVRATFQPKSANFGEKLLQAASDFVGKSRANDADTIAQLLDLFDLPFKYSNDKYVPYCAAGLSFAAALAYARDLGVRITQDDTVSTIKQILPDLEHWYFYPTPSVWDLYLC